MEQVDCRVEEFLMKLLVTQSYVQIIKKAKN